MTKLSPRQLAILAVYLGLTTASPLNVRQEPCGGEWECSGLVAGVPECSKSCIQDAAVEVGCDADDFLCRCSKKSEISNIATPCVLDGRCNTADVLKTLSSTTEICNCVDQNGGPQPACPEPSPSSSAAPPPASSSAAPPPASSEVPPPPVSSSSEVVPPPASSTPPPAYSSKAPEPPSYSASEPPAASSSAAPPPVPSCSAAPAPAPPAGGDDQPWTCQPLVDAVHDCARPCIAEGAAAVGCDADDFECRCANAAAISEEATACVLDACGLTTGLEVRQQTADLCACVASNPPPSGDDAPAPPAPTTPDNGCPAPGEPGKPGDEYPTEPPKDGDDDEEPPKPEPTKSEYPVPAEPTETGSPVTEEPPVVTAGAAKLIGSMGAVAVALFAFLL